MEKENNKIPKKDKILSLRITSNFYDLLKSKSKESNQKISELATPFLTSFIKELEK